MRKKKRSLADLLGETPKKRGRRPGEGGRAPTPSRDRLNMANAAVAELKAAKLRGDLIPAAEVSAAWVAMVTDARQRLLAIPSRVGAKLGMPQASVRIMDEEIRAALNALAGQGSVSDAG